MKTKIKILLKHIIEEALDALAEEHQRGEWWIDSSGETTFADSNIGDSSHEGIVIQFVAHEILEHFGIDVDEPGFLSDYEESIKESLMVDGRLDEKDLEDWDASSGSRCPSEIILKKLIEDKIYPTPEQTEDALYIAYGKTSRDARNYGMKYLKWKIMKTAGNDIEIQTWHLQPEDLGIIVRGIWDIMEEDTDDPEDADNEIGEDNYPGPRVNVTIQATGKRYSNIPLAVLEKKIPSSLINYK